MLAAPRPPGPAKLRVLLRERRSPVAAGAISWVVQKALPTENWKPSFSSPQVVMLLPCWALSGTP